MIELLVLITIATIGVIYTSSTGEAESTAMAEKTAKDALNEAEGQSGIGILGIDVVARKMRNLVGKGGAAVTADTLAEYRGASDDEDLDEAEGAPVDGADEDAFVFADRRGAKAPTSAPAPAKAAQPVAEDDWDDDLDDLDDDLDDWDDEDAMDADWDRPVAAEPAPAPRRPLARNVTAEVAAPARPVAAAKVAPKPAEKPAPKAAPVLDTKDAPLVEEFDPEQDELVIGYRPGEAGNGRIGIAEDPLRPGSAAVTLGGRCVAVVLGGYGKVRAHHIDLVCEDDDMAA